jgi:drug/metabolite transporter (DMT)-like permease
VGDTTTARVAGVALVVVSAASFGALGVFARLAYDDGASPIGVLTCRFGLAAICFLVARALRGGRLPPLRVLAGLGLMGLGYLGQSLAYFSAVDHAPPGLVALLLYTFPAIVVAGSALFLGERLTTSLVVACAVAVVGTAVIVGPSPSGSDGLGIVFGLLSALVYAAYILVGSRVVPRTDALTASAVIMTTAAVGFGVLFLASSPHPRLPETAKGWTAIVSLALLCTVVAGITFLAGLARVGPAAASTLSTIEPVVSVVLSAVVIGEDITVATVIGGALVIGSVVAVARMSPTPTAEAAPAA